MAYADLKNDLVFRKVFGGHAEIVRGLLNDLLDRTGAHAIAAVEYLPPDQAPVLPGYKMLVLDVKCREVGGGVFVVEMQVLPVTGFLNRVVYNACKAYVGTLLRGQKYDTLTDVVAVTVCDFELWPDAAQDAQAQPRIPLVSRWSMAERASGAAGPGLGQVQYVFCELPKLGARPPATYRRLCWPSRTARSAPFCSSFRKWCANAPCASPDARSNSFTPTPGSAATCSRSARRAGCSKRRDGARRAYSAAAASGRRRATRATATAAAPSDAATAPHNSVSEGGGVRPALSNTQPA